MQTSYEASTKYVEWLHGRVMAAGRGDGVDSLEVEPRGSFWLGRLCSEKVVLDSDLGQRGERLDPCAIELRVRPRDTAGPWRFGVRVQLRTWSRSGPDSWHKDAPVDSRVSAVVARGEGEGAFGAPELTAAIEASGGDGRSAEVRVEVEDWHAQPELVVSLVNTSPPWSKAYPDTHIYEAVLEVIGLPTTTFELTDLPDSFRYDRSVPAITRNCGVEITSTGLRTTDIVSVEKKRPEYWVRDCTAPDFSFATLAADPLPSLVQLVREVRNWGAEEWSTAVLDQRAEDSGWSPVTRERAGEAAHDWQVELARLEAGLDLLQTDADLLTAFRLANRAINHAARGKYDSWRPFQLGFLLGALNGLVDPDDANVVDTVWFATGGGKTETYLGLLVTAVFYDRMTGKKHGITAWSRFPLRMLSLQQTQRFADALAGAEIVRREEGISGSPIALGFYVGQGGTPNQIPLDASEGQPDASDPEMPGRYQVLLRCPFCHGHDVSMAFDRASWTLQHCCNNEDCPWTEDALPFHIVDQEIYRFLPAVVVGTLDKAALLGMQAAMRGFVGAPHGRCSRDGHGFCYAPRASRPSGCLVPGCRGDGERYVGQPAERWAPRLRLQDELHLLRDSLGAVDAHYEALLDHLQQRLGGARAKVVASSATLTGYERQVDVLYQRTARVFPQPGPSATRSFWSRDSEELARRYVAVAPRGVTLEYVSDRTLETLQRGVRRLNAEPEAVCLEAGIDPAHAEFLVSNYGVNVVYGNTIRDVDAARRSLDTQLGFPVNANTLTGGTPFEDVRDTLDRLDSPEDDFHDRLHVVAASSMLSHGVDINRLNTMVMLGLPLTTAEFIQTSARIGRTHPGLVYVLHRIAREREAATFSKFAQFVEQGDRFVEPIPVTRQSRKVLEITVPGIVEARRLAVHEPESGTALTTVPRLRKYAQAAGIDAHTELDAIAEALGLDTNDELLRDDLRQWLDDYFSRLYDPATSVRWPNELSPRGTVMRSLRDVEQTAPVTDVD